MKRKCSYILIALLFATKIITAQDNSECLSCHDDKDLTMTKFGREVSLYVNGNNFHRAVHNKLACVKCHTGFDASSLPHTEKITPVNCLSCHKNVREKHEFHPQILNSNGIDGSKDVNCKSCHSPHYSISKKDPSSPFFKTNLANTCGNCHTRQKAEFVQSEHFLAITKDAEVTPNCLFCHSTPLTKNSNLSKAQIKANEMNLCLSCHLKESHPQTPYSKTLIDFKNSTHGKAVTHGIAEAPVCTDCHGVHDLAKASNPNSKINKFNIPNLCGKCHISLTYEFNSSIHGTALKNGNQDVPTCTYCHGEHGIQNPQMEPKSEFARNHILKTLYQNNKMIFCVNCHNDENISKKYNLSVISKAHDWLPNQIKHWETVRCIDCHSSYLPPNLSHNITPRENVIKKCENCHSQNSILISKLYKHEVQLAREKYGFINGTILSNAYVIGTTRNVFLDTISLAALGFIMAILIIHGFLRWYYRKSIVKKKS